MKEMTFTVGSTVKATRLMTPFCTKYSAQAFLWGAVRPVAVADWQIVEAGIELFEVSSVLVYSNGEVWMSSDDDFTFTRVI